jgi:hypothetical protein
MPVSHLSPHRMKERSVILKMLLLPTHRQMLAHNLREALIEMGRHSPGFCVNNKHRVAAFEPRGFTVRLCCRWGSSFFFAKAKRLASRLDIRSLHNPVMMDKRVLNIAACHAAQPPHPHRQITFLHIQ